MIGYLAGAVLTVSLEGSVVVLTGTPAQGVGYRVRVGRLFAAGLQVGQPINLHVLTDLTQESLELLGFSDASHMELFELLRQVQGVGKNIALQAIDGLGGQGIAHAIVSKDTQTLTTLKGIGRKLAERMVNELSNNPTLQQLARDVNMTLPNEASGKKGKNGKTTASSGDVALDTLMNDAISALVGLQFDPKTVRPTVERTLEQMMHATPQHQLPDLTQLLRASLQALGPR